MRPVRTNANGFGLRVMGVVVVVVVVFVVVVVVVVVDGGSNVASGGSRSKNVHKGRCTRKSVA